MSDHSNYDYFKSIENRFKDLEESYLGLKKEIDWILEDLKDLNNLKHAIRNSQKEFVTKLPQDDKEYAAYKAGFNFAKDLYDI